MRPAVFKVEYNSIRRQNYRKPSSIFLILAFVHTVDIRPLMTFVKQLIQYVQNDLIQLVALVFGTVEVFLAKANNVWLYPTGLVAIILTTYSLYNAMLYAECVLQLYYLVMSIYGWLYWTKTQDGNAVSITFSTGREWITSAVILLVSWGVLYLSLLKFTASEVPLWDSWVSATAWAGMWLLARRKVENWIMLNVSNAFAIPLLFIKGLPMLAVLTMILFLVACKGFLDWRTTAVGEPNST